jgi:hypothetical protein
LADTVMDLEIVMMNESSSKQMICKERVVAITFLGEYYAGCGVVVRVTNIDPLLVLVFVQEISDAIEFLIPFLDGDIN